MIEEKNFNETEGQCVPSEMVSTSADDKVENPPKDHMEITSEMKNNLYRATKYFRFVVIVCYVYLVMLSIGSLYCFIEGSHTHKIWPYTLTAFIVLYGVRIVFNFNAEARCACEENDSVALNKMFETILKGAKFAGYLVAFYLFVIVCVFLLALIAGFMH